MSSSRFRPGIPMLIYDGECTFCCNWVERWRKRGEGTVAMVPVQGGLGETYGFSAVEELGAVKLVVMSGEVRSGAAAVFTFMALCGSIHGRAAWWLYRRSGIVRAATEWAYRKVAAHRKLLSGIPGSSPVPGGCASGCRKENWTL